MFNSESGDARGTKLGVLTTHFKSTKKIALDFFHVMRFNNIHDCAKETRHQAIDYSFLCIYRYIAQLNMQSRELVS